MADDLATSEDFLSEAKVAADRHDWKKAATLYQQAVDSLVSRGGTPLLPDLEERIAFCHVGAAFQAERKEDVLSGLDHAIESYEQFATRILGDESGHAQTNDAAAASLYFKAKALIIKSWTAADAVSQTNLRSESIRLAEEAFRMYEDSGKLAEAARCCNHLLACLEELAVPEPEGKALEMTINRALFYGRRAIEILSPSADFDDSHELCRAYIMTAWFSGLGMALFESEDVRNNLFKTKRDCERKLKLLSEKIRDSTLLAESLLHSGEDAGPDRTGELAKEAMLAVLDTRNNLLIAGLCAQIANGIAWAPLENPDLQGDNRDMYVKMFSDLERNLEELNRRYTLVRPMGIHWEWFAYGQLALVQYLRYLAESEVDSWRKEEVLNKMLDTGKSSLEKFRPYTARITRGMEWAICIALKEKAKLQGRSDVKLALLEQALIHANSFVTLQNELEPHRHWDYGFALCALADVKFERSILEQIDEKRINLLRSALELSTEGIKLLNVGMKESLGDSAGLLGSLALSLGEQDHMLSMLHKLTGDKVLLAKRLEVLRHTGEVYQRANLASRVAETHWKMGTVHSLLRDRSSASKSYQDAADSYQSAANEVPSLKELYLDLSQYMRAWKLIETARAAHSEGVYRNACEAYKNAGTLLKSTQRWSPLGEHYAACCILEEAEALSHEENPELSGQAFAKAAQLFGSSIVALASWTPRTFRADEPGEETRWETLTAERERYCQARADLEQAKVLDRRGEHLSSAHRFAAAAAILEELSKKDETTEGKREMNTLTLISRAWQLMKEAESDNSADKYGEAARLFEKASEMSTNAKVGAMAHANVAFCYALQSGTSLRSTHETTLYQKTKKYLETAADYYTQAGMDRASSWTRATQRMFDGLVYLARAEGEIEARDKSNFYTLAERSFEVAANFYGLASYTGKKEQASRYLQYAREQKLVFISPAEALDGSVVMRQSQAQISPGLTGDEPLGVESFETTNVQAKLVAKRTEITLGESMELLVEIVSAGRLPAILVKVTDLDWVGLGVEMTGEKYRIEEGAIALKGHRLQPFETLDLHLLITPRAAGDLELRPRVLYLDQNGQYRHSQTRPIWLGVRAGERTATVLTGSPLPELRASARAVFDYLVKAFIEDYMMRKLRYEQAGWRSLSDVASSTNISRSLLYGRAGKYGQALTELMSRGLVESRILTGQRGRGGEVVKVRIAYDKDPVKRYVDQAVIGSK